MTVAGAVLLVVKPYRCGNSWSVYSVIATAFIRLWSALTTTGRLCPRVMMAVQAYIVLLLQAYRYIIITFIKATSIVCTRTLILGELEVVDGSAMVPFERAIVISCRLSIVTIALSLTIRPQFSVECLRRSSQQEVGHFGAKFG